MKVGTITKQSRERRSVSIFYGDDLDEGDEVTEITLCEVDPPGELTATAVLATEERSRIWIEDGLEENSPYKITVIVTTNGGEKFEDEIFVNIVEI